MKKFIALTLAMLMIFALGTTAFAAEPTEEEYAAWAEANGYVKLAPELATSATEAKGGINYGIVEWDEELQKAAIREWLKGGTENVDPTYAQDESGYNYRNMMQMATSYNNIPNNTNLELVLDIDSMHLLGVSEAGTSKTLEFAANPNVCVAWSRQINEAEEANGYNYYGSYGLSYYGQVKVYSSEDLATEEGQNALINLFDRYYITGASFWGGYTKGITDWSDDAGVREAKLAYITNTLASGAMVAYEIIPSKVVITCPFVLVLVPAYLNGIKYATVQEGDDKYAYELGISDEFIDQMIAYKNEYLKDEANMKAAEEYYSGGMFAQLDPVAASMGMPSHLEMCLNPDSVAGMRTQTTYVPAE